MNSVVRVLVVWMVGLCLSGVVVAADSLRTKNNGMTSVQKQSVGARAKDGKTSMKVTMMLRVASNDNKAAVLNAPAALSNKNNVVSNSQVVVANSQLAMAQNDRFRISGGTMRISGNDKEDSDDSSSE